mgnify:CR=1 FL=1
MTTTQVVALIESDDTRSALATVLGEAADIELVELVRTVSELQAQLEDPLLDVVVIDSGLTSVPWTDVVREVASVRPFVAILLVADEPDPSLLAEVMDAGGRGVLQRPFSLQEVQGRVDAAAHWSRSLRQHSGDGGMIARGRVIAVTGAKGGVGTSVIATLLAQSSVRGEQSVCLVDLDLRNGSIDYFANIKPRRNIADLADVASEITGRSVREVAVDTPSGFAVVAAPSEIERAEDVTGAAIRQITHQLRLQFSLVVVDCGDTLEEPQATMLESADEVVLVVSPDVAALRAARQRLQSWDRLSIRPHSRATLVLNGAERRREVQADLVGRIVGAPVAVSIPAVPAEVEAAVNLGDICTIKPGALRSSIVKLAEVTGAIPRKAGDTERAAATPRTRAKRRRLATESGQSAIELPFAFLIFIMTFFVALQAVIGCGAVAFARHAASEGARAMSVTSDHAKASDAARQAVPDYLRRGFQFTGGAQSVSVSVNIPTIFPVGNMDLRIRQTAGYSKEPS